MRWRPLLGFLGQREVYHIAFWVCATVGLLYVQRPLDSLREVAAVMTSIGFYAAIVYFNLTYLLPKYLDDKRPGAYFVLFVLAAAIATPLRLLVLYWIYAGHAQMQSALLASQADLLLSHLVVGAGSTMLRIAADWTRNTRERQKLEAENLQTELRFLRSQVNPHFLFNTLNSLYALTLKQSPKAPPTVLKLSNMMRYMLYESNARTVPLSKEIDYLRDYLALEQLRHGEQADIRFEVEGELTDQVIAPLLFITFVENAFKHGMSKVLDAGYVHIVLLVEAYEIRFHLENSKPRVNLEDGTPGGIGLLNVERRMTLLYPDAHELHTLETDDAYTVDLYLNLGRGEPQPESAQLAEPISQ